VQLKSVVLRRRHCCCTWKASLHINARSQLQRGERQWSSTRDPSCSWLRCFIWEVCVFFSFLLHALFSCQLRSRGAPAHHDYDHASVKSRYVSFVQEFLSLRLLWWHVRSTCGETTGLYYLARNCVFQCQLINHNMYTDHELRWRRWWIADLLHIFISRTYPTSSVQLRSSFTQPILIAVQPRWCEMVPSGSHFTAL